MFKSNHWDKVDIDLLQKDRQLSPDNWKLEQHEWQLLFVPGELMSRHPRHADISPYVRRARPLSPAWTADAGWSLWKKCLGPETYTIPLINHFQRTITGRIRGELYAVRPRLIYEVLDNYYQNKVEFNRARVNVVVPYRKEVWRYSVINGRPELGKFLSPEFCETIRCWMYLGIPKFWEPQIDSGATFKQVQSFMPHVRDGKWNSDRYFYFSLNEYGDTNIAEDNAPIKRIKRSNEELLDLMANGEGLWIKHS